MGGSRSWGKKGYDENIVYEYTYVYVYIYLKKESKFAPAQEFVPSL